ncbi:hypothetical protein [Mucilaginibacter lappiensis]|uniref:hypothetical protein n=1 Tax=Mucilaginibacter lappiensis TaxID=354630 RepID=UPI001FE2D52E|nr:hypothetical protein [Mucilaginibacter lappiensis]
MNTMLRERARKLVGKNEQYSVVIIDSQSVKTACRGGFRGVDGHKRINVEVNVI